MSFKYLIKSEKVSGEDFPIDSLLIESYDGMLYIQQKDVASDSGIPPNTTFEATVEFTKNQARQLKFLNDPIRIVFDKVYVWSSKRLQTISDSFFKV